MAKNLQEDDNESVNPYMYDTSGPKKVQDFSKMDYGEDWTVVDKNEDTYSLRTNEKFKIINPS